MGPDAIQHTQTYMYNDNVRISCDELNKSFLF